MNPTVLARLYSSNVPVKKSAKLIRKEFLDYFKNDLGHSYVRSSPVVPLHDQTVAFVNAGMNQFKGVFLDRYEPSTTKVVNSQKCIRVGGKHNDLNVVGFDTYHHTFFEMLGNWSFGDYFKEDACRYAWNLLTERYSIQKEFLYVTYFAGDEELGLEPDMECKDIWLRIGVPKEKILPFGAQDNFWEMGLSGPCGPCTEIHVDRTQQLTNRSLRVNKGHADLTELWNIVFIQFERLENGTIIPLPKRHVDTGMGLERLVALLQNEKSNYDTDLFTPLFKAIQKSSKVPAYKSGLDNNDRLNCGYRILADHSRMISVALADGMLPEQNHKLRRIIRKAIDLGESVFQTNGILSELTYTVADNLGDVYPELQNNLKQVQTIIEYEEKLFQMLRKTSGKKWNEIVKTRPELARVTDWASPGLVPGYKDLQRILKNIRGSKILPGNVSFKLYDTYGLNPSTIAELAEIESLDFDERAFQAELDARKYQSKIGLPKASKVITKQSLKLLEECGMPKTDDSPKYQCTFDGNCYRFPEITSKIIGLIKDGDVLLSNEENFDIELSEESEIGIVLNKTAFYSFEGGQMSDEGNIVTRNLIFNVNNVRKINDYVIHFGTVTKKDPRNPDWKLTIGEDCVVYVNPEIRVGAMLHHTGTHLLNASLRKVMQTVFQRGSTVCPNILIFKFNTFGGQPSFQQLRSVENHINDVIQADVPVATKTMNSLELSEEDSVTLVPGEMYPYTGIRVVEIIADSLKSKEACCGTHVDSTGTLEHFCLLSFNSKGAVNVTLKAVVGPLATAAKLAGEGVRQKIFDLEEKMKMGELSYETLESIIVQINTELREDRRVPIPYLVKEESLEKIKALRLTAWSNAKELERSLIKSELKNAADWKLPYIVHCLSRNPLYLSLHEVVSLYPRTPILIISNNNGAVKARCFIPEDMASDTFNAPTWMATVLRTFNVKCDTQRISRASFATMESTAVSETSLESLIRKAIAEAKTFASKHTSDVKVSEVN